ncbi:hypothetical protein Tco_0950358 [Tanacetum coccineum]
MRSVSLAFRFLLVRIREHIKLEYKKLYDLIKKTRAKTKLQIDSLQQKLNDQISENNKLRAQLKGKFFESQMNHNGTSVNTKLSRPLTLGNKLYSVTPLSKLKNDRVVHRDYLKVTKEHVATLQELLEEARALKPLDEHIGHASKFAEHSRTVSTIETITKEHAVKQNTRKTDNTMLPSTGRVSSTNASGSKPRSNTKNDRIPQTSSRSKKNKVKAHHRKFKSSANKNNHVSDWNANVKNIVEIILWYLDSGCSKHMTGHRDKLINFVSKFIRTVRFDNDHFGTIMRYRDLQMRNILISHVYYVEGLSHNLFFVGQFCDSDLEVAFRKHTCFVWNLEGVDLLSGSRAFNLYIISMMDMMKSSPICLLSKALKIKS